MLTTCVIAQTKIAYCDVYARGGGKNMKISFMYNNNSVNWRNRNRTNLGVVLNLMAENGWILDKEIVIPRSIVHGIRFTRHKLHLIMKKEYQEGENPFSPLQYILKATNNTSDSPHKYKEGDNINYNGVSANIVYIADHQAILAAKESKEGTWDEAVKYCNKLGNGWNLPTVKESKKIAPQMISNNSYWTIEEVNEKQAKIFRSHYGLSENKNKIHTILPIAIINPNDLK